MKKTYCNLWIFKDFEYKVVENRSDGSFFTLTLLIENCIIKTISYYYEFIEQQLIVTMQINGQYYTTLEMKDMFDVKFSRVDLIPKGDDYKNALRNNAKLIRIVLDK